LIADRFVDSKLDEILGEIVVDENTYSLQNNSGDTSQVSIRVGIHNDDGVTNAHYVTTDETTSRCLSKSFSFMVNFSFS
jgi:hypothetical protein